MIERPLIVWSVLPDARLDAVLVARAVAESGDAHGRKPVTATALAVVDEADRRAAVG